jgi:outer membrane protein OmpA-like peptidoglycan-associated protein
LDQVAEILKRYSDYNVRIAGHTDNVGSYEFNLTLSRGRARSCYDYLVSKGVSASRITFEGFGSSKPIGNNGTADGRAQNRRTEFELYQK